jgi:hypothetical protein
MKTTTALLAATTILSLTAFAQQPPSVQPQPTMTDKKGEVMDDIKGSIKQARVYFIEPKDGATVPQKFHVKMGVDGIKVRPAGEAPDEMTSGHHHLVIDSAPVAAGQPVPNDEKHMHFGKGQTETDLTLPPGKHTLLLQFADGAHRSFGPKLMQKIEITVKK